MNRQSNLSAGAAAALSSSMQAAQNAKLGERLGGIETAIDEVRAPGIPFYARATLTAAAAGTPVHVVPAANVPAGKKILPIDIVLNVSNSTAWTDDTATIVKLQDTAGTPVVAATYAKAGLTANAVLGKMGANITTGVPIKTGVGLTADKGLDIVGDANFGAGSDIIVSVFGYFI